MSAGLVFKIRRFSLDDGPGIRTTVFFKGCPLSCRWCHNPEGISPLRELVIDSRLCINCGECLASGPSVPPCACETCTACGGCAESCPTGARRMSGIELDPARIIQSVLRDRHFFDASGGGATLSGGEPTLSMELSASVAVGLRRQGIHVALQTSGHFSWPAFAERLLPNLDLVLCDLKLIDPVDHIHATGCGNQLILRNIERLHDLLGERLILRTPLVPGVTDTPENLGGIRSFLATIGVTNHVLLPFNACIPQRPSLRGQPCRSTSITL